MWHLARLWPKKLLQTGFRQKARVAEHPVMYNFHGRSDRIRRQNLVQRSRWKQPLGIMTFHNRVNIALLCDILQDSHRRNYCKQGVNGKLSSQSTFWYKNSSVYPVELGIKMYIVFVYKSVINQREFNWITKNVFISCIFPKLTHFLEHAKLPEFFS